MKEVEERREVSLTPTETLASTTPPRLRKWHAASVLTHSGRLSDIIRTGLYWLALCDLEASTSSRPVLQRLIRITMNLQNMN